MTTQSKLLRGLMHRHSVSDPGHSHGIWDPGHSHTIHYPGYAGSHTHGITSPGYDHSLAILADDASTSKLLESQVIEQLAAGTISSPQPLANSLYYRMRITGTGDVWRVQGGDTYRTPDNYLNDEFLLRCAGLPIVIDHPEEDIIDQETQLVGTVVYGYIPADKPGEVWGIARITNGDAQAALLTEKLSTSPSVSTVPSTPGKEGDPRFIDHLALVPLGVWDHNGPPTGIDQDVMVVGDAKLTDQSTDNPTADSSSVASAVEETNAEAVLADASQSIPEDVEMTKEEMQAMLNATFAPIAARLDKLETKADAAEPAVKEEVKADAAEDKKDEVKAEDKKDEVKADAVVVDPSCVRNDSDEDEEVNQNTDIAALKAKIAALEAAQPKPVADEDIAELADAVAMADSVAAKFGKRAPNAMAGERPLSYRKRAISMFKEHSPAWKGVDLTAINDKALIANIETQVFADAVKASRTPADVPKGKLREIRSVDAAGRTITEFVGDASSWMDQFSFGMAQKGRIARVAR